MGIAYKCDVTGVYADTMDRIKSLSFPVTYNGKTFYIKTTVEVADANGVSLYLSEPVWIQVNNALKARL